MGSTRVLESLRAAQIASSWRLPLVRDIPKASIYPKRVTGPVYMASTIQKEMPIAAVYNFTAECFCTFCFSAWGGGTTL